jgi:hypothetical protein
MNDLNPASVIAGIVFVVLGGAFFLEAVDVWNVPGLVAFSAMVIGLGVAMLAGALWRADRHEG